MVTQTRTTRRPIRRILTLTIALAALALLTAAIGGCVNLAERFFYYPVRTPFTTPPAYEDVTFTTTDNLALHAWFMPAADAAPAQPRPAILHVHGNAGNVSMHDAFSEFLRHHGFHVLVFDYRGYGRSDAAPLSRRALLADTRAALAALRARPDVDPARIGILAQSLGCAFALPAAADDPAVRSVVALSPFATWRSAAGDVYPVLGHLLVAPGQDPAHAAARLGPRPLLILHGDADAIIRPDHARRVHAAATDAGVPAELLIVPGADHNAIIDDHPHARRAIADFFTRTLAPEPAP